MVLLHVLVCLHFFSFCTLAHPASPPPPAFSLFDNAKLNTTVLPNLTHALSALPPDPFHYDTTTPLSIVLYSYGKALNATRVNRLIIHANDDAFHHDEDSPILTERVIYYDILDPPSTSSYITLGIRAIESVTWGQWEIATRALSLFFTTWDVVELQFEIEWAEGLTKIGWGRLVEVS
ncbi:hypothetical protein N7G274_000460 [Stereocaulon virgatum]|uniref:Uncharacterized protein n=1 Tax=Stereocaulon virgatum TaxID=373712 RepID=A0ABR4AYI5_9LECA